MPCKSLKFIYLFDSLKANSKFLLCLLQNLIFVIGNTTLKRSLIIKKKGNTLLSSSTVQLMAQADAVTIKSTSSHLKPLWLLNVNN